MTRGAGERSVTAPLVLLGAAVVVACVGLGAPPRMESVEGAPGWVCVALEALWPHTLVQFLAAAALVIAMWRAPTSPGSARPLVLLLLLGAVSIFPVSWGFVEGTWESLDGLDLGLRHRGTLWPDGTANALSLWMCVLAATLATHAAGRERAPAILASIALLAAAQCALGIATTYAGDDTVLGLAKVSSKGRVTGTFVMPSVLGALAVMGACSALGLATRAALSRQVTASGQTTASRQMAAPPRTGVTLVWGGVVALCAVGCTLTLSRWMVAALVVGLVVTAWLAGGALLREGRRLAGRALRGAALAVPAAGALAAIAVPALRERFDFLLPYLSGESGPVEPRFAGWASTWDLFTQAPLLGTGLGSFGRAIHLTQSVDAPEELWFAHCEPLNLLADAGIVGFGLVLWWLVRCVRDGRAARDASASDRLLAAGAWGGAAGVLVAGLADFPTQFPVIAIPCAALLALPATLGAPGRAGKRATGGASSQLGPRIAAFVLVVILMRGGLDAIERTQHAAAGLPPGATRGERFLITGRRALADVSGATTPDEAYDRAKAATSQLREAVIEEPLLDSAHLWRGLGELTLLQLTTDPDAADTHREAALVSLGRARRVSRGHADVNLQIGLVYLDLLGTERNPFGPPGDTAMAALREAGALRPQAFSRAWKEALARDLPREALEALVPDREHARRVWDAYVRGLSSDPASDR